MDKTLNEIKSLFHDKIPYHELNRLHMFLKMIGAYNDFMVLASLNNIKIEINLFGVNYTYCNLLYNAIKHHTIEEKEYWSLIREIYKLKLKYHYGFTIDIDGEFIIMEENNKNFLNYYKRKINDLIRFTKVLKMDNEKRNHLLEFENSFINRINHELQNH